MTRTSTDKTMDVSIAEALAANPNLFAGKRVLVVGDIALDRTILCVKSPDGRHAQHARETIFDIVPGRDDFGAVGAANNSCIFCRSLGAEVHLVSAVGTDPEGDRVKCLLARDGINARILDLTGIQTVTRIRFFAPSGEAGRFEMLYRFDKDPDIALSYEKAHAAVLEGDFLKWFEDKAATSDIILFNDTDKGFLSEKVLDLMGERIRRVKSDRVVRGIVGPLVIVDPKVEWEKYAGVDVDLLKPNHVEACKVLGLSAFDPGRDSDLEILARKLAALNGNRSSSIVITLGRHGALVIGSTREAPSLHPAVPPIASQDGAATHCGDVFGSALALSLSSGANLESAVDFANYAGSLQYAQPEGMKLGLADLVAEEHRRHCAQSFRPARLLSSGNTAPPI
jgi:bifunctional ADP-heptose synthase (sugar kinase/adenylyltransferase)